MHVTEYITGQLRSYYARYILTLQRHAFHQFKMTIETHTSFDLHTYIFKFYTIRNSYILEYTTCLEYPVTAAPYLYSTQQLHFKIHIYIYNMFETSHHGCPLSLTVQRVPLPTRIPNVPSRPQCTPCDAIASPSPSHPISNRIPKVPTLSI
jgi:hypothetical protein